MDRLYVVPPLSSYIIKDDSSELTSVFTLNLAFNPAMQMQYTE